jgi:myo-inositol-hexaphosphate 3-phosphohydrolase
VNSGSGDATLDFGGNKIEGKVIMTANKKNGKIVAPFTFDKTEEVDNGNNDNVRIRKTVQLGTNDIEIKVGTGSGTAEIKK